MNWILIGSNLNLLGESDLDGSLMNFLVNRYLLDGITTFLRVNRI